MQVRIYIQPDGERFVDAIYPEQIELKHLVNFLVSERVLITADAIIPADSILYITKTERLPFASSLIPFPGGKDAS